MNHTADIFFTDGCGRCPLGATPNCKVHNWDEELALLRMIVLDSELTETLKWGVPCYTLDKSNVLLLGAFKEFCSISFFKGSLLPDPHGILQKPGENSQSVRMVKFTRVQEIVRLEPVLKAYIQEAIRVEKAGLKVDFSAKTDLQFPEEFQIKLNQDPALELAFRALTPGRQRAYNLYFSAPKQAKTRESRIEKWIPQILMGKGMND